MDSPDQRNAISRLIDTHRKIVRLVQVTPFVYVFLLSVYLLTERWMPDWMLDMCDIMFTRPVCCVAGMIYLGRMLRLCAWFRAACMIPLAVKVESVVDSCVTTMYQNAVFLMNALTGLAMLFFLFAAGQHFCNGR